jgi:methylamine dehydrogenase heavy chain
MELMDRSRKLASARWHCGGNAALTGAILAAACALGAAPAFSQATSDGIEKMPELITAPIQEKVDIHVAPPPDERRMYVVDPAAFNVHTRVFPIDGNTGRYLGTIDTGLLPVPMPSPKDGTLYIADTRFDLFSRWNRDDFIASYDPRELKPLEIIDMPDTRSGAMVHRGGSAVSQDGRYAYSYQFSPSNAVVIVDLEQKKHLGTIEVPQCWYVYPTGERRFAVRCRDASIVQISFDESGKEIARTASKPIHEPVEDPTYNDPAFDQRTGEMFLVSYWGKVFPVDLSGDEPKPGESWSLTTEAERKDNWAPGGWQPLDYHSQSGQLFVLMDRRARWAHSSESREVWVFDTRTRKRVKTIGLAHEAACIAVDRADRPYLYALSSHGASLDIYDVETGVLRFRQDQLGREPRLLVKHP